MQHDRRNAHPKRWALSLLGGYHRRMEWLVIGYLAVLAFIAVAPEALKMIAIGAVWLGGGLAVLWALVDGAIALLR